MTDDEFGFKDVKPYYRPVFGDVILAEYIDGAVREAIEVRMNLIENVTREAVVAELRNLGYEVIPPKS